MEAADDVGLCRALGASKVAMVDGTRLRPCLRRRMTQRLCRGCGEAVRRVSMLNAHSEENRRHDTTQRGSSSFEWLMSYVWR